MHRGLDRGRKLCGRDWGVAAALATAYLVLVMSTTSMGITRDESFYIHYGKVYFNWFTKLWRAEGEKRDDLLSREGVRKVWKQNFEHPPLMKVLFGVSWKVLGKKKRPAVVKADGNVRIRGLGISHGFEPGDEVRLLAPCGVGEDAGSRERRAGTLLVVERKGNSAKARVADATLSNAELAKLCSGAAASLEYAAGCQAETNAGTQILSESQAFRLPGALMGALLVFLLFLFAVEWASTPVALLAVAMFVFVPRTFFHAHLTCFDIPITAINFAVLYAFWKSLRSNLWAVAAAILWGLALLAKLNAFFIPITLFMWWGVANIRVFRPPGGGCFSLPRFPLAFFLMPMIGLPMLYVFWPWLWYDTVASFTKYLSFHLDHDHYFQYYFGRAYQSPPFPIDFPFVMTLVTIPLVTVLLFFVGFGRAFVRPLVPWFKGISDWWKEGGGDESGEWARGWFVFVNMMFPVVLIAMPGTPIFGGVKHWLLTTPFLALLAGQGLVWLLRRGGAGLEALGLILSGPTKWIAGTAVSLLLLAPAARDTLVYVSDGTAYYNEAIGGVRGAAQVRMQRQFWSYAHRGALGFVNRHIPARATVDIQDALVGSCEMAKLEGWMRDDLKCRVRKHGPQVMLFDVEERFSEEEMRYWKSMDTLGPVCEAEVDGVPVLRLYVKGAGLEHMKSLESADCREE